jgi:hypothetical protein
VDSKGNILKLTEVDKSLIMLIDSGNITVFKQQPTLENGYQSTAGIDITPQNMGKVTAEILTYGNFESTSSTYLATDGTIFNTGSYVYIDKNGKSIKFETGKDLYVTDGIGILKDPYVSVAHEIGHAIRDVYDDGAIKGYASHVIVLPNGSGGFIIDVPRSDKSDNLEIPKNATDDAIGKIIDKQYADFINDSYKTGDNGERILLHNDYFREAQYYPYIRNILIQEVKDHMKDSSSNIVKVSISQVALKDDGVEEILAVISENNANKAYGNVKKLRATYSSEWNIQKK